MINYTHIIAFAIGGTCMWIVLGYLHRKSMDEIVRISKLCLHDVGEHAIKCVEQLAQYIKENPKK